VHGHWIILVAGVRLFVCLVALSSWLGFAWVWLTPPEMVLRARPIARDRASQPLSFSHEYMGLSAEDLQRINSRLVPLIAHDRAGFGGGVCTCGILRFFCIWCGTPSRSLWQALLLAGLAGFSTAIGIHPIIGYTDFFHLGPAVVGALVFALGLALTFRKMCAR
jgi:hypothetical protein